MPGEQNADEHTEEEHAEDEREEESSEDEHDETINRLLERITALERHNAELEQRLAAAESRLDGHESGFKHEPISAAESGDVEPSERHFYFRRIGRS